MLINEQSQEINTSQMTFDEALTKAGDSHKYQKLVFIYFGFQWFVAKQFLFFIIFFFYQSWILLSPVYLFRDPIVDCQGDNNCLASCLGGDYNDSGCNTFICTDPPKFQYLTGDSITTAFSTILACNNENISSLLQSMPYVGSLVGFFLFSFVADNYGRKLALTLAWMSATIGCLGLGLAQNLQMVAIGYFFTGFGVNPSITIHFSFINEHTLGDFRDIQNIGVQIFFGVGEICLVLIGYFFPEWRILCLFWFTIPIFFLNFGMIFVQESPKFLYSKNKVKSVKVLNLIASVNGKESINASDVQDNPCEEENNSKVYSIIDLIRYKSIRLNFICGLIMFFGVILVYYGISFASDSLGLNFYINNIIIGISEIIAYLITNAVVVKLRRRLWIMIGFTVCGVLSICYAFFPGADSISLLWKIVQTILAGFMRFVISCVLSLSYIYLSELFPTVVRSLALGLCSAAGTFGSISCPFIKKAAQNINVNPIIMFGIIGLFTGNIIIFLKETFNEPLQDDISESRDKFVFDESKSAINKSNNFN